MDERAQVWEGNIGENGEDIMDEEDLPPLVENPSTSMTYTFLSSDMSLMPEDTSSTSTTALLAPGTSSALSPFTSVSPTASATMSNSPSPMPAHEQPYSEFTMNLSNDLASAPRGRTRYIAGGGVEDSGYIPRPPNAFILFRSAFIRSQKISNKIEGNHSTLSKIIGMYWRNLPPEERAEWEVKAQIAQAEHRRQYPDWRFSPGANAARRGRGGGFLMNEGTRRGRGRGRGRGRNRGDGRKGRLKTKDGGGDEGEAEGEEEREQVQAGGYEGKGKGKERVEDVHVPPATDTITPPSSRKPLPRKGPTIVLPSPASTSASTSGFASTSGSATRSTLDVPPFETAFASSSAGGTAADTGTISSSNILGIGPTPSGSSRYHLRSTRTIGKGTSLRSGSGRGSSDVSSLGQGQGKIQGQGMGGGFTIDGDGEDEGVYTKEKTSPSAKTDAAAENEANAADADSEAGGDADADGEVEKRRQKEDGDQHHDQNKDVTRKMAVIPKKGLDGDGAGDDVSPMSTSTSMARINPLTFPSSIPSSHGGKETKNEGGASASANANASDRRIRTIAMFLMQGKEGVELEQAVEEWERDEKKRAKEEEKRARREAAREKKERARKMGIRAGRQVEGDAELGEKEIERSKEEGMNMGRGGERAPEGGEMETETETERTKKRKGSRSRSLRRGRGDDDDGKRKKESRVRGRDSEKDKESESVKNTGVEDAGSQEDGPRGLDTAIESVFNAPTTTTTVLITHLPPDTDTDTDTETERGRAGGDWSFPLEESERAFIFSPMRVSPTVSPRDAEENVGTRDDYEYAHMREYDRGPPLTPLDIPPQPRNPMSGVISVGNVPLTHMFKRSLSEPASGSRVPYPYAYTHMQGEGEEGMDVDGESGAAGETGGRGGASAMGIGIIGEMEIEMDGQGEGERLVIQARITNEASSAPTTTVGAAPQAGTSASFPTQSHSFSTSTVAAPSERDVFRPGSDVGTGVGVEGEYGSELVARDPSTGGGNDSEWDLRGDIVMPLSMSSEARSSWPPPPPSSASSSGSSSGQAQMKRHQAHHVSTQPHSPLVSSPLSPLSASSSGSSVSVHGHGHVNPASNWNRQYSYPLSDQSHSYGYAQGPSQVDRDMHLRARGHSVGGGGGFGGRSALVERHAHARTRSSHAISMSSTAAQSSSGARDHTSSVVSTEREAGTTSTSSSPSPGPVSPQQDIRMPIDYPQQFDMTPRQHLSALPEQQASSPPSHSHSRPHHRQHLLRSFSPSPSPASAPEGGLVHAQMASRSLNPIHARRGSIALPVSSLPSSRSLRREFGHRRTLTWQEEMMGGGGHFSEGGAGAVSVNVTQEMGMSGEGSITSEVDVNNGAGGRDGHGTQVTWQAVEADRRDSVQRNLDVRSNKEADEREDGGNTEYWSLSQGDMIVVPGIGVTHSHVDLSERIRHGVVIREEGQKEGRETNVPFDALMNTNTNEMGYIVEDASQPFSHVGQMNDSPNLSDGSQMVHWTPASEGRQGLLTVIRDPYLQEDIGEAGQLQRVVPSSSYSTLSGWAGDSGAGFATSPTGSGSGGGSGSESHFHSDWTPATVTKGWRPAFIAAPQVSEHPDAVGQPVVVTRWGDDKEDDVWYRPEES